MTTKTVRRPMGEDPRGSRPRQGMRRATTLGQLPLSHCPHQRVPSTRTTPRRQTTRTPPPPNSDHSGTIPQESQSKGKPARPLPYPSTVWKVCPPPPRWHGAPGEPPTPTPRWRLDHGTVFSTSPATSLHLPRRLEQPIPPLGGIASGASSPPPRSGVGPPTPPHSHQGGVVPVGCLQCSPEEEQTHNTAI